MMDRMISGRCVLVAMAALPVACGAVERNVNVWYPGETIELKLAVPPVHADADYDLRVIDWQEREVLKRTYDATTGGKVAFTSDDIGAFGAFRAEVVERGTTNAPVAQTWFARLASEKVDLCPWVGTGTHVARCPCYADGRYIDLLVAAGVGVVREDCVWNSVERKKGEYDYGRYERTFEDLEARGIRLNFLMTWCNELYENPLDADAFAAFCAHTARKFKGRAKHYEIWNEPQNTPWRKVYPNDERDANSNLVWVVKFAELCRKSAAAIHAEDPEATVALTGEDVDWLLYDMIKVGCAKKGDLISFHPYCHAQPRPEREYWFNDGGRKMRELCAANGGCDRFCITEAGWTTFKGRVKYLEIAGCYPKSSYVHQAQYLMRMYILARLTGIEYACQYCWADEGTEPSYTEHNFGQLFNDLTPKPSFAATAFLTRLLGKAEVVGDESTDQKKWRMPTFVRNGKSVRAIWSVEGDMDIPMPEALRLAQFLDLMGNRIKAPVSEAGAIHLTEVPVYAVSAREE